MFILFKSPEVCDGVRLGLDANDWVDLAYVGFAWIRSGYAGAVIGFG